MEQIEQSIGVYQHVDCIRYTIDSVANVIFEEWVGEVTKSDLAVHWSQMLKNDAVMRRRRTVVDITKADIMLQGYDMEDLIHTVVKPVLKDRKWITAIVVGTDHHYGVSRQYTAYAADFSHDRIFRSRDEAVDWISSLNN